MPASRIKPVKKCIRELLGQDSEQKMVQQWEAVYGPFDHADYDQYAVHDLPSESG